MQTTKQTKQPNTYTQYSPLIDHIGKIDMDNNTPTTTIDALANANPHTLKINGRYQQ